MNLLYLAKPRFGGWISFTAHLALKQKWKLFRLTKTVESTERDFGYGVKYQNTNIDNLPESILITAIDKNFYKYLDKIPDKSYIVIHDPTELRKELIPHLKRFKIITIRKTVQDLLKNKYNLDSLFLLHPFYPYNRGCTADLKVDTVSISRIDYDKYTHILIEANNILKSNEQKTVKIYGKKNDLYVYRKLGDSLDPYYNGSFRRGFDELNKILNPARFVVDLSAIKNDGSGSQYTFLEAIYSKCVLIINKAWTDNLESDFINGVNCYTVKDAEELAELLAAKHDLPQMRINAQKILLPHLNINWQNFL